MEILALDTVVLGTAATNTSAKYIQVFIDHHSRYVWAFPTKSNSTESIINAVHQVFRTTSPPKQLITDNALNFKSKQLHRTLQSYGCKHAFTTTYHPQANGLCEKANHTIMNRIRLLMADHSKRKWSTLVPEAVRAYNNTPHDATGIN